MLIRKSRGPSVNHSLLLLYSMANMMLSIQLNCVETKILPTNAVSVAMVAACKQPQEQNTNTIGMWGDVNPNIFYICDSDTGTPRQMHCPEGRGFFNGLGYYGCIPFEDWPACISPNVRRQKDKINDEKENDNDTSSVLCDSEHLLEPWEASDPNKFYMCADAAIEPVLVNCEIGKGFVTTVGMAGNGKNASNNSKIVGCAAWEKWRSYMQCEQYY